MTTQPKILERVLKDLRYYQQYGAKVILETAIFDLEQAIKEPPASKPWIGMTEEDREQHRNDWYSNIYDKEFDAIEAKLREKNQ